MQTTITRRAALTGAAALPALAIPAGALPALSLPAAAEPVANGTEAAWRNLIAARAGMDAKNAALDAAEVGWQRPDMPDPTAELPALEGGAARRVTLSELRKARDLDAMLHPMSENVETIMRETLANEMKLRPQRTPEAVGARRALYERLEAELEAGYAAVRPVKPAQVARLEREADAACERVEAADDALLAAPVLTVEDAARKLEFVLDRQFIDRTEWHGQMIDSALDGLCRIARRAEA